MSHPTSVPDAGRPADLGITGPVHGALGTALAGIDGFRATFEQARAAQALTIDDEHPPALARYADTELLCLIGGRTPAAGRMVRDELGDLAGDTAALGVLRRTALAYLTTGLSAEAAASALVVHPNTVRYRLTRAEQFLGHRLTDRVARLEIALRYADRFGVADLT
jgi:DNA-binding PucR family transcriptional regulator